MNDMKEDRGELDLTLLIEKHQKEIWDYKQRESEWIRTDNLLKGAYKIVDQDKYIKNLGEEIEKLVEEKNK